MITPEEDAHLIRMYGADDPTIAPLSITEMWISVAVLGLALALRAGDGVRPGHVGGSIGSILGVGLAAGVSHYTLLRWIHGSTSRSSFIGGVVAAIAWMIPVAALRPVYVTEAAAIICRAGLAALGVIVGLRYRVRCGLGSSIAVGIMGAGMVFLGWGLFVSQSGRIVE